MPETVKLSVTKVWRRKEEVMKQGGNIRNTLLLFSILFFLVGTGSIPGPAMAQTGLVAYYPFDGNANDVSGNGYNGTPSGGVTFTADRFGNPNSAVLFDGSSGSITTLPLNFASNSTVSVSLWLKANSPTGGPATYYLAIDNTAFVVAHSYYPSPSPGLNQIVFGAQSGTTTGTAGGYITPGNWYHFVGTYDGTTIRAYINGSLIQQTNLSGPMNDPNSPLNFGGVSTYPYYWNGSLDDVRIYNRALTDAEVAQLYSSESGLIDRTKWANLEFIRRAENGALHSALRNYGNPQQGANSLFLRNPIGVTSIEAKVTVNAFDNNSAYTRARIGGFFFKYDDGSKVGDYDAGIYIGEDLVGGLRAAYFVERCFDVGCNSPDLAQSGVIGPVNIGESHTLRIVYDTSVVPNTFKFYFDNAPLPVATVQVPPSSGPPLLPWMALRTNVFGYPLGPGQGGYVDAKFENVLVNNASTAISDANGMIDRNTWSGSTLEFVREQISDGVYGMALRSYGSFADNLLNLINGQDFKELQADLTVEQLVNTPSPNYAIPMAALFGSYYNVGGGALGTDATGDIRASVGIRISLVTGQPVGYYIINQCTKPNCDIYTGSGNDEFQVLYYYEDPKTIGPDLVGKSHTVSIRYDDSSNPPKFIFGFDGRLTTYPSLSDPLLPSIVNSFPNVVRKGPFTRVRVSSIGGSSEGYVSAQFANIATVVDTDGDGVPDSADNCPTVYNPIVASWVDINGQLHSNSQPDFDLDGVGDACDLCPKVNNDGGPCPSTGTNAVGGGTASTTGPLIKVTFTYNGPATFLVPPNCNNVVFSSVPEIPQNCRFREPYILKIVEETAGSGVGRPGGDWIPVTAGYTSTINCNPLEIFDEDSLKAAGDVTITPMYTLFFEDPGTDYAGNCLPNEICVDTSPGKYNLFQGTMVANPVTLTQPQISNSKNVSIDIRPLSHRNIINIQSCGYVPVAIFSAPDFDARTIKIETVKMGDAGVKTVVIGKKRIPLTLDLDVNRDGLKDKVVFFDIKALNLAKYTPPVCLTGETTGGISFIGCDSVTIVSQKSWNWLCRCEDED